MKNLALIILAFVLGQAHATNYYFSSSSGNDARSSSLAQNPSTPWKSIDKINFIFANLQAGDSILLKRGDIFRGTITASADGNEFDPIVISSYGVGAAPIIIALSPTINWNGPINGVYSTTLSRSFRSASTLVWEDGIPLQNYATNSSCLDGSVYGSGNMLFYRPKSGTISNHEVLIDTDLGSFKKAGIDVSDRRYITIENIAFKSSTAGVSTFDLAAGTKGITISNCSFEYCHSAILFMPDAGNNTNATIEDCFFYRNQNAIRMYTTEATGGRPGQTHGSNIGCNIINNEMSENGTIDGKEIWVYGTDREAIGLQHFIKGTVKGNYVHGGSQIGIIFYNLNTRSSDDNLITNNIIHENNRTGITFNGDYSEEGASANYGYNNNTIANNQLYNSGEGDGAVVIYQGARTSAMNYFYNNTLVGPQNTFTLVTSRTPYFSIKNNLIYNPGPVRFIAYGFTTKPAKFEMDYNLYFEPSGLSYGWQFGGPAKNLTQIRAMGLEQHSKIANPLFIDEPSHDFRLAPLSPAVDAGIDVGLSFDGNAPDMGAHEIDHTILPLQFLSFDLKKEGDGVVLQWSINNEAEVNFFEVQKSKDGINFNSINRIEANRNSAPTYSALDPNKSNTKSYYRIRHVAQNGTYTYSQVLGFSTDQANTSYIYPNPARDKIQVSLPLKDLAEIVAVQIITLEGGIVKNVPLNLTGTPLTIDIADLKKGSYVLSIIYRTPEQNFHHKFIKQ